MPTGKAIFEYMCCLRSRAYSHYVVIITARQITIILTLTMVQKKIKLIYLYLAVNFILTML